MATISGSFYFKVTAAGNLLGEYAHKLPPTTRPECAMRTSESSTGFVGDYLTTWYEQNTDSGIVAGLRIRLKTQGGTAYSLLWFEHKSNRILFTGEAVRNGDALEGTYSLPTMNLNG